MRAVIYPSRLAGQVAAIASKSQAHRLLICAALADRETEIRCATTSADIDATAACLRALGARIERGDGTFSVRPMAAPPERALLDCGESGSTLRFLLPVVCALGTEADIVMHGRLPERPLSPLWEQLEAHGVRLNRPAADTISVSGRLTGRDFALAAGVSSQFVSGLLFALPQIGGGRIALDGTLESASYVDMTVRAQALFGVTSTFDGGAYTVPAEQRYVSPGTAAVEGDWSNAAFWICADRVLGGALRVTGLDPASPQGDRAVERLAREIAAGGAIVDCRDVPDLAPALAALASVSPGVTRFVNAGRLRIKESDRLTATAAMLNALGARVEELPDGLVVTGVSRLRGGEVSSENDHRIAMSAAVAALGCEGPVVLRGAETVNKSYPAFWEDYRRLGGHIELEDAP